VSLLNDGRPMPLHEIPRGAFVQMENGRWRQLAGWRVLDKDRPDSPRFQVLWAGSELYPSTYRKEPSWPARTADENPEAAGAAGQ
jgi:hypothetical protein